MSLSDLSEDIFDAIFLEIFPGNADGIIKDVLNVYKVSKQLKSTVENAQGFWENASFAAGFKVLVTNASGDLAWDPEVPPQGTWWLYFCARMRDRYKIRRLLRMYIPFLDHWSRGSFQYGLDASDIAEMLSKQKVKLPWQIQELYHWKNGQNSSYMGVQFAYGTRLLSCVSCSQSLQEVLEGFGEAMKAEIPGPGHELVVVEGAACFPLTTERAGKQYCFDSKGAIYLKTGWNSICVAEDLAGFLQLLLRSATAQPDDASRQQMALALGCSRIVSCKRETCPSYRVSRLWQHRASYTASITRSLCAGRRTAAGALAQMNICNIGNI